MHKVVGIFFLFLCICSQAQSGKRISRTEYIDTYKKMAMDEMKRTGIPASITLAQGCLESGDGNSTLAKKANNHFGIKCHDWKGPSIKQDDDAKNECFRKYKSAEESYRDHSDFLTSKSRYAELFDLKPGDYKGWAKGLKRTGYATSPTYAEALIKLVEDFELNKYDEQVLGSAKTKGQHAQVESEVLTVDNQKILYNNRVKYIVADSSDTYSKISDELHLFNWQLPHYNEVNAGTKLRKGDYIYLQPKRNVNYSAPKTHTVKTGETLHSISQFYGIKESKLRIRNKIQDGSEPNVGAVILLRGKLKQGASIPASTSKDKSTRNNNGDDDSEFQIEFD
jgi:hypothetical protein